MRRLLAVSLALLLGLAPVVHAADLEPVVTKAPPVYKAPEEAPFEVGVAGFVLIPIGLVVACLTVICKEEKPPPAISAPPT